MSPECAVRGLLAGLGLAGVLAVNWLFILSAPRRRVTDFDATVIVDSGEAAAARLVEASSRIVLGSACTYGSGGAVVFARTGWESRSSLPHEIHMWVQPRKGQTAIRIRSVAGMAEPIDDVIKRRQNIERLVSWWRDQAGYVECE